MLVLVWAKAVFAHCRASTPIYANARTRNKANMKACENCMYGVEKVSMRRERGEREIFRVRDYVNKVVELVCLK